MEHSDVAIVGGGLAGSTAAAMLGRAGIDAVMIDPHPVYPPDFRCEKLDESQVTLIHRTGVADAVLSAAARYDEIWVARLGQLVQKRRTTHYGILYEDMVNAMRGAIPSGIRVITGKVAAPSCSADRQRLMLSDGSEISARLVVLANGLNSALRRSLGIAREELSAAHSISFGFDAVPAGDPFPFQSLTYFPETTTARIAYFTLFPIPSAMRANLFVYRDVHDPWLHRVRDCPQSALFAALPGLRRLTDEFSAANASKMRPVDLTVAHGWRRPGVVLVGDAFSTSCPAAGTGVNKVFTDVAQLCTAHIPEWLATPGMAEDKIAAFYEDPVKRACDEQSTAKAFFLRSLSTESGLAWRARRFARFAGQLGFGLARQMRQRLYGRPVAATSAAGR